MGGRAVFAWLVAAGVAVASGCSLIESYDGLVASADAGSVDGSVFDDAEADGVAEAPGAGDAGDAGPTDGPPGEACTSDPHFCDTHCGQAIDDCGSARQCGACGTQQTCDPGTHQCTCVELGGWCQGRCGPTVDNCNQPVACGGCDGGLVCSDAGACGCVPETTSAACGARVCGSTTNNCNQQVPCGPGGTTTCAVTADVCETDGGCCAPDNVTPCTFACGKQVSNNCGQTIGCPACTVVCYADADKDGYGNPATPTSFSGACAPGYVADKTDCYDANASAHPGQTAYFTTQRGDGSFDYDCNGTADKNPAQVSYGTSCNGTAYTGCTPPSCMATMCSEGTASTPACGASYPAYVTGGGTACNCVAGGTCSSGCTGMPIGNCGFATGGPGSPGCSQTSTTVACR